MDSAQSARTCDECKQPITRDGGWLETRTNGGEKRARHYDCRTAEIKRLRAALEDVAVALGYLDATPLDEPGVRAAHLESAIDVIASALDQKGRQ